MNFLKPITILVLYSLIFSCYADSIVTINNSNVKMLMNHFFKNDAKLLENGNKSIYQSGDFNGDGVTDIVAIFLPNKTPKETKQVSLYTPWEFSWSNDSFKKDHKPIHSSLVIFNINSNQKWDLEKIKVYVQLSFNGELEARSLNFSILKKNTPQYNSEVKYLPKNITNDLIILPTDAGIDTYLYWDKDSYKFYAPNETP